MSFHIILKYMNPDLRCNKEIRSLFKIIFKAVNFDMKCYISIDVDDTSWLYVCLGIYGPPAVILAM